MPSSFAPRGAPPFSATASSKLTGWSAKHRYFDYSTRREDEIRSLHHCDVSSTTDEEVAEHTYMPPMAVGVSVGELREAAQELLVRSSDLVSEAERLRVRCLEGVRWNSHFPRMYTEKKPSRPYRPSIPRLVLRAGDYLVAQMRMRWLLERTAMMTRRADADLRKSILTQMSRIPVQHCPKGHSHPLAASERTSVNVHLQDVLRSHGMVPYVVSAGPRDFVDKTCHGCRLPYFAKDLTNELFMHDVGHEDAFVFVDVDYYTDMSEWLKFGRVCLLYTFVPEDAAGLVDNGVYELVQGEYVDPAGAASHEGTLVRLQVAGGEKYEHPLWDYSRSHVTVDDCWGNRIVYLVESRRCPSGRRIVAFFPEAVVAWPYGRAVRAEPLQRLEAGVEGVPVLELPLEQKVSIGASGTGRSLRISLLNYVSWVEKYDWAKVKFVGDVEKWMRASGLSGQDAQDWHAVVFALLRQGWTPRGFDLARVIKTGDAELLVDGANDYHLEHYVLDAPGGDDGSELTHGYMAIAVAPALVNTPTPVPIKCRANAAMAHQIRIAGSVEKFRNHTFTGEVSRYAREFVEAILVRTRDSVVPLDLEQLAELWVRPTQRRNLEGMACWTAPEPDVDRGFLKGEPGAKPRLIVNKSVEHNAPLGCFVHPITEKLKHTFHWIGCGLKPEDVSDVVSSVVRGRYVPEAVRTRLNMSSALSTTHEGDITNCDGSQKKWHRQMLIDPICIGITSAHYRRDLRARLKEECAGKRVKTAEGFSYEAGDELPSGTSLTTLANILKVAFGDFLALRRCGLSVEEAMACLGVYCGDDSVMVALPIDGLAETRVVAMADIAMEEKMIVRHFPEPVSFLGLFHYGAWTGEYDTMCDFWRTALKVHVSTNRSVPKAQALANKCVGLLSGPTRYDPLLGPWCERAKELCGASPQRSSMTRAERWRVEEECDWALENLEDVEQRRRRVAPAWSQVTGIDLDDLEEILARIRSATTVDELPRGVLDSILLSKKLLPGVTTHGMIPADAAAPPAISNVAKETAQSAAPARSNSLGTQHRGRGRGGPAGSRRPRPPPPQGAGTSGRPDGEGWVQVGPRGRLPVQHRGRGGPRAGHGQRPDRPANPDAPPRGGVRRGRVRRPAGVS